MTTLDAEETMSHNMNEFRVSAYKFDLPDEFIYVGRPRKGLSSVLGNPYSHLENTSAEFKVKTVEESVAHFEIYARKRIKLDQAFRQAILATRGKHLVCWCYPKLCHITIIRKLAEEIQQGLI